MGVGRVVLWLFTLAYDFLRFKLLPIAKAYQGELEVQHKDILGLAHFYCLIVRYGGDGFLRDLATDNDRKDGRLDQMVVNKDRVLPVRFFCFQELRGMLSPFFHIQNERVFHELYPKNIFDLLIFRDSLLNMPWSRNFFGRDMIIEAKKK